MAKRPIFVVAATAIVVASIFAGILFGVQHLEVSEQDMEGERRHELFGFSYDRDLWVKTDIPGVTRYVGPQMELGPAMGR